MFAEYMRMCGEFSFKLLKEVVVDVCMQDNWKTQNLTNRRIELN